jgi:hypothetical protein
MYFSKFFYFKFGKHIPKFFPEAKKIEKCIPKYLIKGKKKDWGYRRNMGVGREIFKKKAPMFELMGLRPKRKIKLKD